MRTSGTTPTHGGAPAAVGSLLSRLPVKATLLGSASLVILFCGLVIVTLRLGQSTTFEMVDSLINVDGVIADLCLKSNAAMIDARRLEKDFLLTYREFGFDESRSRYITRLAGVVAGIKENMQRIRSLAGDGETARRTRVIEDALDRYRQGIETLVERIGERGYLDTGVYGAMRAAAHEMEELVRGAGGDALLARLLEVRRGEKDFIERTRDADVTAVREAVGRLVAAAGASALPAASRARLRECAASYLALFERYARMTDEIRTVKQGYLRSVQAIDPLLEQLYAGFLERVLEKQRAIERRTRLLSLPLIVVGGLVLVLTGLAAVAAALTVTRSVVESKTFAERIAAGDLGARLVPRGRNEFYSLATALNRMGESLHAAAIAREGSLAALRESEEQYRALVETSTDWIWAVDMQGQHTYSNDRVLDILGLTPEELVKTGTFELLHPEDAPRARALLAEGAATGKGWQGAVLRWRHRDGGWRWLESSAVALRDARGVLAGFRGTDRDVTDRLRLEEEQVRVQKLEAIGTLAGGIAHDFNNLLQGVFGYISLARMDLAPGSRAAEMLAQAEKALTISVNLTTQLLTFAKGGRPAKRRVALPAIVEDAAKFALSGSRTDYRLLVDGGLCSVEADPGQIAQVVQNLVLNAGEAMSEGGTVEIAVRNEAIAEGRNPLAPAGGDFVRVEVRDAGAGIAAEHLGRIFDPYFTTKRAGSGLGLATAYSIVRDHKGFIDVASRPGEGSVFSVHLPASPGGAAPESEAASGAAAVGRRGRVLLMDDDEIVRGVGAEMIVSLGHAVTAVAGGEEAVEEYRRARAEGRPFDAVILDLTVKRGMGGEEAIRLLRALDPGVKAVVSSGYSDAALVADYRSYGFSACLSKPYVIGALRDCLLSLLAPGA
jgi:PAS domain S-box-containing protein